MRLAPNRYDRYTELEMQAEVADIISKRKFSISVPGKRYGRYISPRIYREVSIPQIRRISDVIVYITDRRIVNIECKLGDYAGVIHQAKDHLRWADYSYVCFCAEAYLPVSEIKHMIEHGIGLLLWLPGILIEPVQSKWNRQADKSLHDSVIKTLQKKDHINTGITESEFQQKLILNRN